MTAQAGRCFDVGEDMFNTEYTNGNQYTAQDLEAHTKAFASKVLEKLQEGLDMNCSTVQKPNTIQVDRASFVDMSLATLALKLF